MALTDSRLLHGMVGSAIGDAVGLPVQGQSIAELREKPVDSMRGYGAHNLPAGDYSDETALVQASLVALTDGFDLKALLHAYQAWYQTGEYAPYSGPVIDVWPSVEQAITQTPITQPEADPGGLIRTLPLAYYLHTTHGADLFGDSQSLKILGAYVALTNPDAGNLLASSIYVAVALRLLADDDLATAIPAAITAALNHFKGQQIALDFAALTDIDAAQAEAMAIGTPTARNILGVTLYALTHSTDYRSAVLTAVNMGNHSDTTGALVGGLAGLAYGYLSIPHKWCLTLAKYSAIVTRVRAAEDSGNFPNYD